MICLVLCGVGIAVALAALFCGIYWFVSYLNNNEDEEGETEL